MDKEQKLIKLYQKMSDLTAPECANVCKVPHSCCSTEYCLEALAWAKEKWSVDLNSLRTGHVTLPFMSATGCVVPPHLRPMCTLHTCAINGLGFKPNRPVWTKTYFKLREQIEIAENLRVG